MPRCRTTTCRRSTVRCASAKCSAGPRSYVSEPPWQRSSRRALARNSPQHERVAMRFDFALGLPVAQPEAMRDDTRAGRQLGAQLGQQLRVGLREQEQGDDAGLAQVDIEDVLLP